MFRHKNSGETGEDRNLSAVCLRVEFCGGGYDGAGSSDLAIFDVGSGRWFIREVSGKILGWNINWGWPGVQAVGR